MMVVAKNKQREYQMRIAVWFERFGERDRAIVECNVQTSDGTKIADVAYGGAPSFLKETGMMIHTGSPLKSL